MGPPWCKMRARHCSVPWRAVACRHAVCRAIGLTNVIGLPQKRCRDRLIRRFVPFDVRMDVHYEGMQAANVRTPSLLPGRSRFPPLGSGGRSIAADASHAESGDSDNPHVILVVDDD